MANKMTSPPDRAEPKIGRRERNKLEKRTRIVAAARRLFAEQGYSDTTTLQIAEAADIGTGTLFLYARSKEDLLVLVFKDEMVETALDSFRRLPEKATVVDKIFAVFERMVEYHARDEEVTRILLREMVLPAEQGRPEIDELLDVIFNGFAMLIRDGQAKGLVAGHLDPLLTAQSIFAIYYFGLLGWLSGRTGQATFFASLRQQLGQLLSDA